MSNQHHSHAKAEEIQENIPEVGDATYISEDGGIAVRLMENNGVGNQLALRDLRNQGYHVDNVLGPLAKAWPMQWSNKGIAVFIKHD